MQIKLPISDAAFFSFGHKGAQFIRNTFSWATKSRQNVNISIPRRIGYMYMYIM